MNRQPKGSFECMDVSSSSTIKERKSLEKAQDKVQPDQSQVAPNFLFDVISALWA